jgi:hypothetical protein
MNASAARDLSRLRAGEHPTNRDASWRAAITQELLADLRPEDHALAAWLLEQEIAAVSQSGASQSEAGDLETLYQLVAAVARFARPADALLIWRAAQATPETRLGVDVEQALRAGPEATLRTLHRLCSRGDSQAQDAAAALVWVEEGVAEGAASDLPAYFAWSDERFGLRISGPT